MFPDPGLTITWLLAGGSLLGLVALLVSARRDPVQRRLGSCPPAECPGTEAARACGGGESRRSTGQTPAPERGTEEEPPRSPDAGRLYGQAAFGVFFVLRIILMVGPAVLDSSRPRWAFAACPRTASRLIAGWWHLGPGMWLDHVKRSRQTKIRRALPDALDVMVVCLQGG